LLKFSLMPYVQRARVLTNARSQARRTETSNLNPKNCDGLSCQHFLAVSNQVAYVTSDSWRMVFAIRDEDSKRVFGKPLALWLAHQSLDMRPDSLGDSTRESHSGLKEIEDAHHTDNCAGTRIRWGRRILWLRPMGCRRRSRHWTWNRVADPAGVLSTRGLQIELVGREDLL